MIALLLLAAIDMETKHIAGMEVRFRVELGDEGAGPGLAQVYYHFDTTLPEGTEVDGPRLEDAFAAWRVPAVSSSWSAGHLSRVVHLVQRKPGTAPLPGVVLRLRLAGGTWQELTWPEPLLEPRDVPPIEPQPPLPPRPLWPWYVAGVVVVLAGLALGWRRRAGVVPRVDAAEAALTLIGTGHPDAVERGLREYVRENWGIESRAATRGELVEAVRRQGVAATGLDEALLGCEKARFSPPGCEVDVVTPARAFIEATRVSKKNEAIGQTG